MALYESRMYCNATNSQLYQLFSYDIQQNIFLTCLLIAFFTIVKTSYDRFRWKNARLNLVIIGAGPVGVTAAMIAIASKRASNIIIYEENERKHLYKTKYQVAFDNRTTSFLTRIGVDFDNIEGCWDDRCFYTRAGIYLEYMLTNIHQSAIVKINFNKKAQQQLYITIIFLAIFLGCRKLYSQIKRNLSQLNLIVVGAGPVGLTSALVAIKSGKIAKAIIFEEKGRNELINRSYQVSFDNNLVSFLQKVGVDFDHIEGCWQNGFFHTKVGVYLEYLIDVLQLRRSFIEIRFNTKFDKDTYKELDSLPGRLLVIVCDGRNGNSSSILGLGDEYEQHSCAAYGAVAAIDRMDQREVPTP
ncbi:hypothetical protein KUTeg_019645 [Tegillarca granosa]|uniref:FAD-binding domain-containing protein n=1 Tax=Tegillarca granosa TaxID=220873 RepID=A0ABQ9ED71_TEGGR|nr:hypothetical protein KUTeg_019645 [Tegillarca granosa]